MVAQKHSLSWVLIPLALGPNYSDNRTFCNSVTRGLFHKTLWIRKLRFCSYGQILTANLLINCQNSVIYGHFVVITKKKVLWNRSQVGRYIASWATFKVLQHCEPFKIPCLIFWHRIATIGKCFFNNCLTSFPFQIDDDVFMNVRILSDLINSSKLSNKVFYFFATTSDQKLSYICLLLNIINDIRS